MREGFARTISFWNENFPHIKRLNVLPDLPSPYEAHGSLPVTDKVESYSPSAILCAPVLEVRRDAKWRVTRYSSRTEGSFFERTFLRIPSARSSRTKISNSPSSRFF